MAREFERSGRTRPTLSVLVALAMLVAPVVGAAPAQGDEAPPVRATTWVDHLEHTDASGPSSRPVARVAGRAARVLASAPAAVLTGTRIKVAGLAPLPGRTALRRVVVLQEKADGRWRTRARDRANRSGGFVVKVGAGTTTRNRTFRVRAPRVRHLAAATSRSFKVRVSAPVPAPPDAVGNDEVFDLPEAPPLDLPALGRLTDWTWLQAPATGRWDPCRVITWQYNPDRDYDGALTDLKRAFAQVAGRTGLRFRYLGTSTFRPEVSTGFPEADIAVGWETSAVIPAFERGAVGIGGNWMQQVQGKDVGWKVFSGFVAFNSQADLPGGHSLQGPVNWGQAMVHEVLHVVGLGHAAEGTQIMSPTITRNNHLLGAGDIAGAVRVGALRGCL